MAKKPTKTVEDSPGDEPVKEFDSIDDATDHLAKKHGGHGKIVNESGDVIQQCRCGDGPTVKVCCGGIAKMSNVVDCNSSQWLYAGVQLSAAPVAVGTKLGQPVYELWSDALVCGDYTLPATGQKLNVDHARLNRCAETFKQLTANGFPIAINEDHKQTARTSLGFVTDAKVVGDRLRLKHQFIGEDGAKMASRNFVSVELHPTFKDSKGNVYKDAITHSALTPAPVIHGQTGFSIAASRGQASGQADDSAPVYILAGSISQRIEPMFTPEYLTRIRKLPGAKDVTDEGAAEFVLSCAEKAMTDAGKLTEQNTALLSRATVAETLAAKSKPTAKELYFARCAVDAERDQLMSLGWSKGSLDTIELSLATKPVEGSTLTLSREVTDGDHLISNDLTTALAVFKSLKSAKAAPPKGETTASQHTLTLSRATPGETKEADESAKSNPWMPTAEKMSGKKLVKVPC